VLDAIERRSSRLWAAWEDKSGCPAQNLFKQNRPIVVRASSSYHPLVQDEVKHGSDARKNLIE
jgi:hypothetical protein